METQMGTFMKFIHIADIHLGAKPDRGYPWSSLREKEIWESFEGIIEECNKKQADLLLIAGDLFHKQPLLKELKEVNYLFQKLNKTRVVLMAGNHDYIGEDSNYRAFLWADNVHMLFDASMDSIYLEEINTEIYGFSYHTRNIIEYKYHQVAPGCEERINILLAHGGDEKNVPFDKRVLQEKGFDYIALGHIHKPQKLGERMAYAGSLEPMDKNEVGDRGYIYGEINKEDNQSDIKFAFYPFAKRRYFKVELAITPDMTDGSVTDTLKGQIRESGSQNMYCFRLTGNRDKDITFHKEKYYTLGNIIEITDETVPDYDFDELLRENRDNLIGLYIEKIKEESHQDNITQKALYYGMEALLGAKN
ncbi:serine/threonine phosphatase [Anaerocolumna cellulosilytica]|uniref:Serine/threonine phosphatase n=1 Tax=Anaerocolumna cellulosilytica TaxID=433286 RepID=A0A6S6QSJ5_9FIRM|nr:exonuclease SbcCD subunit D [Anaerocolumna cellulosilytica]MBB5197921.1 DNA repair exonuclease SbcCD nuclease subunit [Anaerocolumna cellulosilytica]BCJ92606.1 serine/threonine phosphatase [Anaerocolumna cellulosilytica]